MMCGDDSNIYTRLPVLLAREQGMSNPRFHHGALDGRFVLKKLSSEPYLAKGEMERDYLVSVCRLPAERVIVAGPPLPRSIPGSPTLDKKRRKDESLFDFVSSRAIRSRSSGTEDVYRGFRLDLRTCGRVRQQVI